MFPFLSRACLQKSSFKSQTKSSTIEAKPAEIGKLNLQIDKRDPDSFWKVMEIILREKAMLSQKEITNFVNIMKKVSNHNMNRLIILDSYFPCAFSEQGRNDGTGKSFRLRECTCSVSFSPELSASLKEEEIVACVR
jgi:hypothetical protein